MHKVILTAAAEAAVQVQTGRVRIVAGREVIPATAVVYDPTGASWTYLAIAPRTYVRQAIDVDHVTGGDAVLRSGPAAGATVVTVGAPELLGAEYGVGEE